MLVVAEPSGMTTGDPHPHPKDQGPKGTFLYALKLNSNGEKGKCGPRPSRSRDQFQLPRLLVLSLP